MEHFAIAVKSFIIKDECILLLRRSKRTLQKPGVWEIPGGRLEQGEDPVKGLERETKEETGLDIRVIQPLEVRHFTRDDGQTITMIVYLCQANNVSVSLSEEHTEYIWVPVQECKKYLVEFFHSTVDTYTVLASALRRMMNT